MIRTTFYNIYELSKESAISEEELKRIINEFIHRLLSEMMKASLRELTNSSSMDGSLSEILNEIYEPLSEQANELFSKIIAIVHATFADFLMEIKGNDYGKLTYLIKMILIGAEREIWFLNRNADLLQIFKQAIENQDTMIAVTDGDMLEKLARRIFNVLECKNSHDLHSIADDVAHLISMFNPEKEIVE